MRTLTRPLFLALALGLGASPALAAPAAPPRPAAVSPAVSSADDAPAATSSARKPRRELYGTVNLNQASQEALELLPGIGEAKAQKIIAWRQSHPFKKVEDLTRVKGFGKKTLAKLKPWLAVSGPTTISDEAPAPATR